MPISWNTVLFKFRLIFATDERRLCRVWSFICQFPLTLYLFLTWINGLPQKQHMEGLSRYNYTLIGRKNQAKFENNSVSINEHKIKNTQPNSMIVSFSSAEAALSNDVKYCTGNQPFSWDTRYTINVLMHTETWDIATINFINCINATQILSCIQPHTHKQHNTHKNRQTYTVYSI